NATRHRSAEVAVLVVPNRPRLDDVRLDGSEDAAAASDPVDLAFPDIPSVRDRERDRRAERTPAARVLPHDDAAREDDVAGELGARPTRLHLQLRERPALARLPVERPLPPRFLRTIVVA